MSSANAPPAPWTTSRGVVLRYGIAVLSIAVALGLSLLLRAFDITATPFLMAIAVGSASRMPPISSFSRCLR